MSIIYNIGIGIYTLGIKAAALSGNEKAKLWVDGRRSLFENLEKKIAELDRERANHKRIWFHISSLGEFEIGRSVIESIREQYPDYQLVLTFFSPSGYQVRKNYPFVDCTFYLPSDTPRNAKRFLEILKPDIAIFVKYDFWLNYLRELKERGVATYLVSAIFRKSQHFFKFYGKQFRDALHTFNHIFLQDTPSKELLESIGYNNSIVTGDTRNDRIAKIPKEAKPIESIALFKGDKALFAVGSSHDEDIEILLPFIKSHPELKYLITPHEISQEKIDSLIAEIGRKSLKFSKISDYSKEDIASAEVMFNDTVGILNQTYQYADWAYIGGAFGTLMHNVQEPAVYGMPIIFGPKYHKFKESVDLISVGAAQSLSKSSQIEEWFSNHKIGSEHYKKASLAAKNYIYDNLGATEKIITIIMKK